MIPVLGALHYKNPEITQKFLDSVPEKAAYEFVIVDNSPDGDAPMRHDVHMIRFRANLGVAHGWNTIIKATPYAQWWAILNSDIVLDPNDLVRLEQAMHDHDLVLMGGYHAFGVHRRVIKRIGWFDESFHPAYCEDNDFTWRAQLAGMRITQIPTVKHHEGSVTIRLNPILREKNDLTFPRNVEYYHAKWGGHMGAETYKTPFNGGGSIAIREPDIDRLADQRWG